MMMMFSTIALLVATFGSLGHCVPVSELAGINQLDEGLPMPGNMPDDLCTGHKDGDLIADPHSKANFYECNGGKAFKFHCPDRLIFDPVKECCNYDPDATTVRPPYHGNSTYNCSGKADGFYADDHDPAKFHECHDGYAYDFVCPENLVFDPNRNACVRAGNEAVPNSGSLDGRARRSPNEELDKRLREKHIDPHQLESTTLENFDIWID